MKTIKRIELENYINNKLEINNFQDYGPNGLQIEGQQEVSKIAFAVSATKESIESAVEQNADTLIVHHGLFWKFHGIRTITHAFAKRVKPLIKNDINLFGYHLPLDAHPEIGNAKTLANHLGLKECGPFGNHKGASTGIHGTFSLPQKPIELKEKLEKVLDHKVLHSCPSDKPIKTLGIITGGANGDWVHCLSKNIDAYLTGEMSEHDWHEAKESGIHMFAGGHHATERFGIQALQELISKEYGLETIYIDSQNPA
jgi:dinuclear metal center YbgI/SA1388 family protein